MTLSAGQILQNRHRVISLLAQGGMDAVYRAWDTRLNIPVALKEMIPQAGLDSHKLAQLRRQFQREAQTLARFDHPHLVDMTDFFAEAGNVYLVMKFIEGESLAHLIERPGRSRRIEGWRWTVSVMQGGSAVATSSEGMFWFDPHGDGNGEGDGSGDRVKPTNTPPG